MNCSRTPFELPVYPQGYTYPRLKSAGLAPWFSTRVLWVLVFQNHHRTPWIKTYYKIYSSTSTHTAKLVYNGNPWDPRIVSVVHRWLLLEAYQSKLLFNLLWPCLGWLLSAGCRCSEKADNTGFTVFETLISSAKIPTNFILISKRNI